MKKYNEFINESYSGIDGLNFEKPYEYDGIKLGITIDDEEKTFIEFVYFSTEPIVKQNAKNIISLNKKLKKYNFKTKITNIKNKPKLILDGFYDVTWQKTPNYKTSGEYELREYSTDNKHFVDINPMSLFYINPLVKNGLVKEYYSDDRPN